MQPIIQRTLNNTQQPDTKLTPETVVSQLRAIRDQLPEIVPQTPKQRTAMRKAAQIPPEVLQASINVIGVHQTIEQAVGQPVDEVRSLQNEWDRWTAVEDEMRSLLKGVSGANAMRRQRLLFIANQAYLFGSRLSRDPANAELVPHVQQIKTLRRLSRRKKAEQPTPATQAAETPVETKA